MSTAYWGSMSDISLEFLAANVIGFDTEFYGVDVREFSTAHRSRMHVASVSWVKDWKLDPRGFPQVEGAVMSKELFLQLRGKWEDPLITKVAHNAAVDIHTAANEGISMQGVVNTLSLVRWLHPEWDRKTGGSGFDLDSIGELVLGSGKSTSFKELTSYLDNVLVYRKMKVCSCQKPSCRSRGEDHVRSLKEVVKGTKEVTREYSLEEITEGHPRWDKLLEYAAQDAVLVLRLYFLLVSEAEALRQSLNISRPSTRL